MEPGIKEYLLRIVNTISLGLLWMAINTTAGIMYDLALYMTGLRLEISSSLFGLR
jgi:hypothetical protein